MSKIDPGPGYRLLEDEEIVQVGDEFLALDATWKPTKTPGVKFSRERVPKYYRRKVPKPMDEMLQAVSEESGIPVQSLALPIPGSPEDKASLAELDSLIPAPGSPKDLAAKMALLDGARAIPDWAIGPDSNFLQWVADRLVCVHKDPANVDFVLRLRDLAKRLPELPKPFTPNKYTRELLALDGRKVPVDVYSVLAAFPVGNAAVDHALKKLLAPGQRGQKDRLQDLKEARASLDRAIQMEGG